MKAQVCETVERDEVDRKKAINMEKVPKPNTNSSKKDLERMKTVILKLKKAMKLKIVNTDKEEARITKTLNKRITEMKNKEVYKHYQ